jgi:hypothetical protein
MYWKEKIQMRGFKGKSWGKMVMNEKGYRCKTTDSSHEKFKRFG